MRASGEGRAECTESPRHFRVRCALQCALFLVALFVTLAGAARVAAPGGGDLLGSKLEAYTRDAHALDTVFLGSSHVYRAFVPELFDAELAAHGASARSFNLGVQSSHVLELEYLTRHVLSAGRGALRRLLVEYQPLTPELDPANAFLARAVHWHDGAATALALECSGAAGPVRLIADTDERSLLGLAEDALPDWWELDRIHLQHFAKRALLVARWDDVAKGLLGRPHGQTAEWRRTRGYLSLEEDEQRVGTRNPANTYRLRREAFRAGLADYAIEVEELAREATFFGDEEWLDARLEQRHELAPYRRMAAAARAAGVEFILVVMPQNACDRPAEERLAELGVPVFCFNRPQDYPELYDPELRFDSGHANAEGARLFTRRLAGHWLATREFGP